MRVSTMPAGVKRQLFPSFRLRRLVPYILLTPAFALLTIVLIYPGIYNVWLSLWKWRYTNLAESRFVGLENYQQLLFEDPQFWQVLRFTLLFVLFTILLEFLLGLGSALLLNRISVLRGVFVGIGIMPYQVAPIAVGLIWRLLWAHQFGVINYAIEQVGLDPVPWLGVPGPAMVAVIVTEVWRAMPFVTIILLAGLTSIPVDIIEAGKVDGASAWQRFWRLILPLLLPSIAVALMFETIFKLRVFDLIFNLTGGGPGISTMPLGILIYRTYFRYFQGGYSATISVILLILGAFLSLLYIKFVYRETEF